MYAVWYVAAGCLPDSDIPEFVGSFAACEAWIEEHLDEFCEFEGVHNTYQFTIEPYEEVVAA
jgi:hypothetical protein